MPRSLRLVALALPLLLAGGTLAQTFQGLDSSPPPPKKTKPKPSTTSTTKPASATQTSGQQGLGLDLTTPAPPPAKTDLPMPPPPPSKKGTAPTTTFEALDVSGRTADRQRLEAANASFQRGEYDKAALAAWELMNDPKMAPLAARVAVPARRRRSTGWGMYHSPSASSSRSSPRGRRHQFFKQVARVALLHQPQDGERAGDPRRDRASTRTSSSPSGSATSSTTCWRATTSCAARRSTTVEQKGEADKSFDEVQAADRA